MWLGSGKHGFQLRTTLTVAVIVCGRPIPSAVAAGSRLRSLLYCIMIASVVRQIWETRYLGYRSVVVGKRWVGNQLHSFTAGNGRICTPIFELSWPTGDCDIAGTLTSQTLTFQALSAYIVSAHYCQDMIGRQVADVRKTCSAGSKLSVRSMLYESYTDHVHEYAAGSPTCHHFFVHRRDDLDPTASLIRLDIRCER